MLLEDAHAQLGWPDADQVLDPVGAGARVYASYARQKVRDVLRRSFPGLRVEAGVLSADPNASATEAPIAIVCQFPRGATDDVLDEAHRLAWNFSRTALLITLEPTRLIVWSCCEHPKEAISKRRVTELPDLSAGGSSTGGTNQDNIANLLRWVSLLTGDLFRKYPERFRAEGRADSLLLQNLRYIRRRLIDDGMPERYCHDLLARIIFTQFLFHRKDSDGRPFFDKTLLEGRCEGTLKGVHDSLASILTDKTETYALFQWLDERFNGDLFPGNEGQSGTERETAWRDERDAVTDRHLAWLADFVSGKLDLAHQQHALWPLYSFDTIPLEFISSVYEEFLNEEKLRDKAYYTKPYLVDFVLDSVLPWEDDEWNVSVLDPSCGSGIFLVKAFQRIIYRWRRAHPNKDPLVSDIKPLLAKNFVGVDKNPEAVRVACFSLYLAMADAIEPKYYLKREKVFPRLRGIRLLTEDFFDEAAAGIRCADDAATFHLVIGNAPWGDNSIKSSSALVETVPVPTSARKRPKVSRTKAEIWAKAHDWPTPNNDIGPLFLGKAATLVRSDGRVAMIQPASTLLYQRAGQADRLRERLFTDYTIDEIVNLTAIRREVFSDAIAPACVVILGTAKPDPKRSLLYSVPKRQPHSGPRAALVLEPQDANSVTHAEAAREPLIWTVMALGGRRDWRLISRLASLSSLDKLESSGSVICRLGVIPGDEKQELTAFRGRRYFDLPAFPSNVFLDLDANDVPAKETIWAAATYATDVEAYKQPQLIIKQSFSTADGRYRAAQIRTSDPEWGVVCKKTYLSVRDFATDGQHIRSARLAYNSRFAAYYLTLTSSRALYNTELLSQEVRSLPLPELPDHFVEPTSFAEVDELVRTFLQLNEAENTLVDDFLDITLPGLLRKKLGAGHKHTTRIAEDGATEPELTAYVRTFIRVVKATFGERRDVSGTIFQESDGDRLPVRMVGIHLDWPKQQPIAIEPLANASLYEQLQHLYGAALQGKGRASAGEGIGFQRVAFLFHLHQETHGRVRTLYVIKPDERRYWSRSLGMRDADQLAAAILKAAKRKPSVA